MSSEQEAIGWLACSLGFSQGGHSFFLIRAKGKCPSAAANSHSNIALGPPRQRSHCPSNFNETWSIRWTVRPAGNLQFFEFSAKGLVQLGSDSKNLSDSDALTIQILEGDQ
mmetsp:Transcript_61203/g.132513  ORF Transcript_61203/g.132513 Transcript_61203/m.132513 type:complete len:111 (-) Transcript_61203:17-349(-)